MLNKCVQQEEKEKIEGKKHGRKERKKGGKKEGNMSPSP